MAAVVLALANEDIGDHRFPFIKTVTTCVESLISEGGGSSSSAAQPPNELHLILAGSKRHASNLDQHSAVTHRSEWDRAWTSGTGPGGVGLGQILEAFLSLGPGGEGEEGVHTHKRTRKIRFP